MSKRIALVGHCGPDSSYLRMAITTAVKGAQVTMADDQTELQRIVDEGADLLLFNREMPMGFDDNEGVPLIRRFKASHPQLKVMLISNYPDAQAAAVQAGALPGFGKREIGTPRVTELLREALQ